MTDIAVPVRGTQMKILAPLSIALIAILSGCAGTNDPYGIGAMLPGRLIALSDGRTLPMQIEITPISHPVGKLTASDPKSGEVFNGSYTCIVGSKVVSHSTNDFWGGQETGQSIEVSNVAPCTSVLVGNKGTVLNIKMTARAGHPPVGTGDAEDNKGKKYSVQF